jgi:hypothetical protein
MPVAPWAGRVNRAHSNAVENLVIFASKKESTYGTDICT